MISLDERAFLFINGFVGKWAFLDSLFSFLINDYFVVVVFSFLLLVFWFAGDGPLRRAHFQTGFIWTSLGLALTNVAVKLFNIFVVYRDRPFIRYPDTNLLFYRPHDSSFPSNSVAVCFAFAIGIFMFHRRAGVCSIALAVVFAVGRVYAGIHYPLDVVGGAAIGAACVIIMWKLMNLWKWFPETAIRVARVLRLA